MDASSLPPGKSNIPAELSPSGQTTAPGDRINLAAVSELLRVAGIQVRRIAAELRHNVTDEHGRIEPSRLNDRLTLARNDVEDHPDDHLAPLRVAAYELLERELWSEVVAS